MLLYGSGVTLDTIPEWHDYAECRGVSSDVFFLEEFERQAKSICVECLVRAECLDYALANRQDEGIWGGKTKKERAKIRRRGL